MSLVGRALSSRRKSSAYGPGLRRKFMVALVYTGLWQVHGRSDIGYLQRVELDRRYSYTMVSMARFYDSSEDRCRYCATPRRLLSPQQLQQNV